jgi:protein TonB
MAPASALHTRGHRAEKLVVAAVVIALHVVALAALSRLEPVRSALTAAQPIVVSLLRPAPPKVEPRKIEPPKPLPRKREVHRPKPQPVVPAPTPAPVLTAAPEAPAPQVAPPPPPPALVETKPAPPAPAPAPIVASAPPAPVTITPPRFNADYLRNPAPAYPPISRRMGEEGKVILRVHVNERGMPAEVQIKSSSGSQRLDTTALETVKQWKFVPARRGDTPVDAWVLVPISFSLRS